jgi:3-oxoacyl-[acyl-carrier protein] reductase
MRKFDGKTVLITGSAKGIGRSSALMFAREGANIVVNYLSSELLANQLVEEIESIGSQAIAIKGDVAVENDVINMINIAISRFGKIDILVNNAGFAKDVPILERSTEDWAKTLRTNLIGPYLCIKYASQNMLDNGGGKIINISSTSAIYSFSPDIVDYDAAKAGVIALTKNFAKSLAPSVLVNAIAPGWVDTDMNKDLPPEFLEDEKKSIYLKRFAQPDEIAKTILFLASEDSNYITGTVLVVDGGHD